MLTSYRAQLLTIILVILTLLTLACGEKGQGIRETAAEKLEGVAEKLAPEATTAPTLTPEPEPMATSAPSPTRVSEQAAPTPLPGSPEPVSLPKHTPTPLPIASPAPTTTVTTAPPPTALSTKSWPPVVAVNAVDNEIDNYVETHRREQLIVGLALGVVYEGEVVYLHGYGLQDRELGIPVSATDTKFRWASVSKPITAVAAMTLVQGGLLDLDRDIRDYYSSYNLPHEYMTAGGGTAALPSDTLITLRMILGHLSGIQHYSNGTVNPTPEVSLRNNPDINTGFVWALDLWMGAPLLFLPGERYSYTTMGFNLAGAVIGAVYNNEYGLDLAPDQSFRDLVSHRISTKHAPGLQPDYHWEDIGDRAKGYKITSSGTVVEDSDTDVSWKLPGGGYISTVSDMAGFCRALMTDNPLDQESKNTLFTRQKLSDGTSTSYGLGFFVSSRGDKISHSGSQEKARSYLVFFPDDELCIVVVANTQGYSDKYPVSPKKLIEGVEDIIRQRLADGDPVIITR